MKNQFKKWKSPKNIVLDINFLNADKVSAEKRKRNQIYMSLDYFISMTSFFDFFSFDTFRMFLQAKYFAILFKKEEVSSEMLLFPFLNWNTDFTKLLEASSLTKKKISFLYAKKNNLKKPSLKEKLFSYFYPKKHNFEKEVFVSYSYDINLLIEKAAENASNRFKTLVITPEILFITLLEDEKTNVGKIIKKLIGNEFQLYLLRYKLLKRVHLEELSLRKKISPNQHYFGYILKSALSTSEFQRLLETETLELGVSFFRNKLISEILKVDFREYLDNEIYQSISVTGKRTYTS